MVHISSKPPPSGPHLSSLNLLGWAFQNLLQLCQMLEVNLNHPFEHSVNSLSSSVGLGEIDQECFFGRAVNVELRCYNGFDPA